MLDYVKNNVKEKDLKKKNHLKIFNIFSDTFTIVKNDIIRVFHNFFPFLSDYEILKKHCNALFVPEYSIDTHESLRHRCALAIDYLSLLGTRGLLIEYLDIFFHDRYSILETPRMGWQLGFRTLGIDTFLWGNRGFRIYITNLTASEKKKTEEFLDNFLEADIEFYVLNRN